MHAATDGFTACSIAASATILANAAGGVPSEPYSFSFSMSGTTSLFLAAFPALRAPSRSVFIRPRPPPPPFAFIPRLPPFQSSFVSNTETTSTVRFSCNRMCASLEEYGLNITSRSGRFGRGANPPAMRDRCVLIECAPSIEVRRRANRCTSLPQSSSLKEFDEPGPAVSRLIAPGRSNHDANPARSRSDVLFERCEAICC
mmetsp:Transcript_33709/g.81500  ORF Transcript_33709/g.81500 Transcript_33709/m.81500 type:complete len:201 (-) Transcript_33709:638-1240(-)